MNDTPRTTGFDWYGKSPNNIEIALHVELADLPHLEQIVAGITELDAKLAVKKFTRSDRLDKPTYTGGGWRGAAQRQEDPVPAGLHVPSHDGQPMRFIAAGARQDGTRYSARFVCRADKLCTKKDKDGRPFADWTMHDEEGKAFKFPDAKAKASEGGPAEKGTETNGATPPRPDFSGFWFALGPMDEQAKKALKDQAALRFGKPFTQLSQAELDEVLKC